MKRGAMRPMTRACRRAARLFPALPDGAIGPAETAFLDAHLTTCAACRREAEAFLGMLGLLREVSVPEATLPDGAQIAALALREGERRARVPFLRPLQVLVPALALVAAIALFQVWRGALPWRQWTVTRIAGTPIVGASPIRGTGRLRVGEWVTTDAASRARIQVGEIGEVEVEPNTRVRLLEMRARAHRMALARGALAARVSAPPRLFYVETPAAVAVDLGCAYRLEVDEKGSGRLRVLLGRVALERGRGNREARVPAGAACEMRPGVGPGTPYFEDAPAALRAALKQLDFGAQRGRSLEVVLAAARPADSFTLWHLLPRVAPAERGRVHDRLAAFVSPPAGVTREGILRLDRRMVEAWWKRIEVIQALP
jgi:predicted anti-sigma-YlaC factor YlaD